MFPEQPSEVHLSGRQLLGTLRPGLSRLIREAALHVTGQESEVGDEQNRRKLYWWNMPTDPDKTAEAGGKMMRTVVIWFGVVVAVIAVVVLIQSLT